MAWALKPKTDVLERRSFEETKRHREEAEQGVSGHSQELGEGVPRILPGFRRETTPSTVGPDFWPPGLGENETFVLSHWSVVTGCGGPRTRLRGLRWISHSRGTEARGRWPSREGPSHSDPEGFLHFLRAVLWAPVSSAAPAGFSQTDRVLSRD